MWVVKLNQPVLTLNRIQIHPNEEWSYSISLTEPSITWTDGPSDTPPTTLPLTAWVHTVRGKVPLGITSVADF